MLFRSLHSQHSDFYTAFVLTYSGGSVPELHQVPCG